jgi:phage/plasmid-like protein (TIGR03299 family)
MPFMSDLDVALRAYVPAFEQAGRAIPATITATNISKVRKTAGLDWEPVIESQYRRRPGPSGDPFDGYFEEVPEYKYVTRGEGGPIIKSANASYPLFSNGELFEVAEAIGIAGIDLGREVRFVAGGELYGGKKVYLLADLGVTEIKGDPSPHVRTALLLSGHDGSAALKVIGTSLRFRCTNAIRAAELDAKAAGTAFTFRHTSRMAARIADAQTAIKAAMFQHDLIEKTTRELLAVKVTKARATAYLSQFALAQVISKSDPQRASQAAESHQRRHAVAGVDRELRAIFASPTCDGIRGTAYGPFAAAIEYLDNARDASGPDARFKRTMIEKERGKVLALNTLRGVLL